jgi:hypothetical protein
MATNKSRIEKLEKKKPVKMTSREFVTLDGEAWERSKNALADALNITRAELEKQLTELFSNKPTAKP